VSGRADRSDATGSDNPAESPSATPADRERRPRSGHSVLGVLQEVQANCETAARGAPARLGPLLVSRDETSHRAGLRDGYNQTA